MLKHITKLIWKNRKTNGWIFAELLLVCSALWFMADRSYVDLRTYYTPLGYDISNVWFLQLESLSEGHPDYVPSADPSADLLRLREQVVQQPWVEEACFAFYSSPYSFGNSWSSLYPVDGDTTVSAVRGFQMRNVTPEYFDVFRVTDKNGNRISPSLVGKDSPLVISSDMEAAFFPGSSGLGRRVSFDNNYAESYTIAAVCMPIRFDDYSKSEPCFYNCLRGSDFANRVAQHRASSVEFSVKMKAKISAEEMNAWLLEMGERLSVNNLYVYRAKEIATQRKELLKVKHDGAKTQIAVVGFVLINVFFGIIGTFWLRTQARRGETGLRIAVGASRFATRRFLYAEGLCLLALTLPFVLLLAGNMLYFDIPDTHRIPYSLPRFLITFMGSYLLIAGMIVLGISLPARKASRLAPAEALRYE